jgi:plasmid maintenance system killer protein
MRRRLNSLHAAPTLADLEGVPGRCHALGGDRIGQFAMTLWGPYRLVFVPAGAPSNLPDGGTDRESVTAIEIVEVTNYHDD